MGTRRRLPLRRGNCRLACGGSVWPLQGRGDGLSRPPECHDASIIVFWDGAECDEELEDVDFDALMRVVARLDASWDRMATGDLESATGDTPPMFGLTLEDGRRVRINVRGYEGRIVIDGDSWQANRDALSDLKGLYDLYYYRYLLPVALEAEGVEE